MTGIYATSTVQYTDCRGRELRGWMVDSNGSFIMGQYRWWWFVFRDSAGC